MIRKMTENGTLSRLYDITTLESDKERVCDLFRGEEIDFTFLE